MARKERNDIDYFPHTVSHGKKMFYLRSKHKNDGYAIWFMLLEQLGKAQYHYLDLSDEIQIMYLSSEFMVEEEILRDVINTLVKFGDFDADLWNNHKIIFNEKFVESVSDAYKKRNNECVSKGNLYKLLGIPYPPKGNTNKALVEIKGDGNPQTKLKDIKGNETKEDLEARKLKFSAALSPFREIYGDELVNAFYNYWSESNESGSKFRKEMQKTWDTKRRIETWSKNDNRFGPKNSNPATKLDKLKSSYDAAGNPYATKP